MGRTGQRRSLAREPIFEELGLRALLHAYPRDLVDGTIDAVGCAEQRERMLPAHLVLYFVLGLALFPHLGYREVLRRVLKVTGADLSHDASSPALSKARRRLGVPVFEELFRRVTPDLSRSEVAVPGFGRLNVVTATRIDLTLDAGLHALRDVPTGAVLAAGISTTDRSVPQVWSFLSSALGGRTLVVADELDDVRPSVPRLIRRDSNDLLWRPGAGFRFVPESVLSDGSVLCRGDFSTPRSPRAQFRVLDRNGGDPMAAHAPVRDRLMTTWLDHRAAPARMLAALHGASMPMARSVAQRDTTFVPRSKDPAGVEQEIWALLLAQRAIGIGG
ncbi:MAG TPA: transposase domain-containing protein [Sporichthyaceae bacterium]|nr:transposase domain-containing protein [Sporichthyaceae bacterium]